MFEKKFYIIFIIILFTQALSTCADKKEICPEFASIDEDCSCSQCLCGLRCSADKICVIEEGTCCSYQWKTDEIWTPSCEKDGSWSAKQCKGDDSSSRCFCYSAAGKRIFGWSWWKNSKNMTCECSRRREELKTRRDLSLHCKENGNYEELQCDNGLCWCADEKTGEPIERIFPEAMMKYLPCYKQEDVGLQYLRQCESKKVSGNRILKKLEAHGRLYSSVEDALCDGDGSYLFLKIIKKNVYCTWKDSSRLENYQSTIGNINGMNCNCARDTKIFSEENLENLLSCQENGNYEALQYINGHPFCVDSDGFGRTPLGDYGASLNCILID